MHQQFLECGGEKGYLDEAETYKMFIRIHALVTFKKYDIDEEELDQIKQMFEKKN